ncbi:hypothetical protein B0H19DRAFT_1182016 [Mycena capillaripes]|nr:hypothetical protein B0H19DRAFT_1182016 [Mycena capillaripes]
MLSFPNDASSVPSTTLQTTRVFHPYRELYTRLRQFKSPSCIALNVGEVYRSCSKIAADTANTCSSRSLTPSHCGLLPDVTLSVSR